MPGVFDEIRTARVEHRCNMCGKPIVPGEKYQRKAYTPGITIGTREEWEVTEEYWIIKAHYDCEMF